MAHVPLAEAAMTWNTLTMVCRTELVPKAYRNRPDAALGAVLMGRELGLGEMSSLQLIDVIDGRPSLSAELLVSMVRRQGHSILATEWSSDRCTVKGTRCDGDRDTMTVTWTMDDAQRAGLAGKGNWSRYPQAMLWARAVSQLVRALFPDCLTIHAYTPADLSVDAAPEAPPSDVVEAQVVDGDDAPALAWHDHGDGEACYCDAAPGVTLQDLSDSMDADSHQDAPGQPETVQVGPDTSALEAMGAELVQLFAVHPDDGTMADIEARVRGQVRLAGAIGFIDDADAWLHKALTLRGAEHITDLRRAELVQLATIVRNSLTDQYTTWLVDHAG